MPDLPHAPVGLIAKGVLWLKDAFLVPGRIRVLADGQAAEADKRPHCVSCAAGRVGELKPLPDDYGHSLGTCDRCEARYYVGPQGQLNGLYTPKAWATGS